MYCQCCPCCKADTNEKQQLIQCTALPTWGSTNAAENARRVFQFSQSASSPIFPPMFSSDSEVVTQQPHMGSLGSSKNTSQVTGNKGAGCSLHKLSPIDRKSRPRLLSNPDISLGGGHPCTLTVSDSSTHEGKKTRSASLQDLRLHVWDTPPIIQFSLLYDTVHCTLMVHLHYALNLPPKDRINGKSDPFVVVSLTPNCTEEFKSKVVPEALNPMFNQCLQFQNIFPDDLHCQTLHLKVYDHDKLKRNDWIGVVTLPLADVDLSGVAIRMELDHHPTKVVCG